MYEERMDRWERKKKRFDGFDHYTREREDLTSGNASQQRPRRPPPRVDEVAGSEFM